MTLRPSARRCARMPVRHRLKRTKWTVPGRVWMSTSRVALAGTVRRVSSGKAISQKLVGGAAVVCLVIGAGAIVYNNIIAASVYPTLGDAGYVEPVSRRAQLAPRTSAQAVGEAFGALPMTSVVEKPAQVAAISPTMFNERFSAAAAQGVASRADEAPSAPGLDAPKV